MPSSSSTPSGNSQKKKSDIVSDLLNRGFLKGSKEYKREYLSQWRIRNREKVRKYSRDYMTRARLDPKIRAAHYTKWKSYSKRKGQEWNRARVAKWCKANPERWKSIMKNASIRGLHRRWYAKNRLKKLKYSFERSRRLNATHGLKKLISEFSRGHVTADEFLALYSRAFTKTYEGSDKG